MPNLPELLTPKEVAGWLAISEASLAQDRFMKTGIPYIKVGKRVRYRRDDIISFLDANRYEVSA